MDGDELFAGQVLDKDLGWSYPQQGMTIAAFDDNRLVWHPVTQARTAPADTITVRNDLLHYTTTADHEIPILRWSYYAKRIGKTTPIAVSEIAEQVQRISAIPEVRNTLRWHHHTHAVPKAFHGAPGARFHITQQVTATSKLLAHWGHVSLAATKELAALPVPGGFYALGAADAAQTLCQLMGWLASKGMASTRTWVLQCPDPGMVQAILLFNGIYSRQTAVDTLQVWSGTRKACAPVLPLLSSRTTITHSTDEVHHIDVPHPFVRNHGKVVAL